MQAKSFSALRVTDSDRGRPQWAAVEGRREGRKEGKIRKRGRQAEVDSPKSESFQQPDPEIQTAQPFLGVQSLLPEYVDRKDFVLSLSLRAAESFLDPPLSPSTPMIQGFSLVST